MDDRHILKVLGPETAHYYQEVEADHLSLLIGKDMTYFTGHVMSIIKRFHPLPSDQKDTKF